MAGRTSAAVQVQVAAMLGLVERIHPGSLIGYASTPLPNSPLGRRFS